METKQKDLIETVGINNQSKSSQSKPKEVGIKVSIVDYDQFDRELYVATNTEELANKIALGKEPEMIEIRQKRHELLERAKSGEKWNSELFTHLKEREEKFIKSRTTR